MNRKETVKEGERKSDEVMVEKLKRGILVGKREGKSTPSPTWKFGLVQPDGTLIEDSNFSTNLNSLSARKLGANLWEMEPQLNHRVANINENGPLLSNHRLEDKSKELDEEATASKSPSKQEMSGISFRKQLAASLAQHNARVDKVGQARHPPSSASCSSPKELAPPHRTAVSPNRPVVSNGKFGESSYSLKTSTEMLKVLNKIWSLEEKHALDMSLVRALKRDLELSQARNQELMQEKKRDQNEIDRLMEQMTEYKVSQKREQQRIKDAVKLVEDKLRDELKLRRHSESRHHKLAKELSQMKSSFSNVLRELDRERKARMLLEELCDEFAKGIRDYEREVRIIKHKCGKDQIGREGNDRLILHISEAWLDERAQMKLADASNVSLQQSALDKLCHEIESFLREKQSESSKTPSQSRAVPHTLESFHLNEPASAPWHGNDEYDSIGMHPHLSIGHTLKQANEEAASDGCNKEATRPKQGNEKAHSRRGSDPSCSQIQVDELLHERSRNMNSNEASCHRMPRKGEILQLSAREGKTRATDADADTETRLGQGSHRVEGFFDSSTFVGPTSPAIKWTSWASAGDPDTSESCMRWRNSVKPNTLKAKLIEARLEGQQCRSSKGEYFNCYKLTQFIPTRFMTQNCLKLQFATKKFFSRGGRARELLMAAASFRYLLQLHRDVPKAARFYSEGLGFTIDVCTLRWAELHSGPLKLSLLHSPRDHIEQKGYTSLLSFTVTDINSTVTKLMALGAELDGPIKHEIHGKVAAMRGADGHVLGLYEPV